MPTGANWERFQYDPNKGPIEQQMMAFLNGRPLSGTRDVSNYQDRSMYRARSFGNGGDDGGYRTVYEATDPALRGNNETGVYFRGQDGQDYSRVPWLYTNDNYGVTGNDLGAIGMNANGWDQTLDPSEYGNANFHVDNMHGLGDIYYSPDYGFVTQSQNIRDPNIRRDNWLGAAMFAGVVGPALYGIAGGAGGAGGAAGGAAGGGLGSLASSLATPGNLIRAASLAASLAGRGGGSGGMGGGGGGGGGGSMQYQWSDEMRPRWQRNLDRSEEISNRPYAPYTGQRIAGLSGDEQASIGGLRDLVANGGTALGRAGNDYTQGMLGGSGLTGMFADPYANQGNAYSGNSPEFQNMVNAGLRDMGDAYDRVARDTNRRAAAAGVFGGSDHNATADVNEGAYGKRVADFVSGMRNDQYNRSAGLEESRLGRGSSAWQAGLGRMSDAARLAQGDQGQALARLGALGQAGTMQRGINQSQNDFDYQQYVEGRDWDKQNAGWLTGMFGTAQGGQFPTGGGQGSGSNAMNWAGLGLSAAGMAMPWLRNWWGSGSGAGSSGIDWNLESGL